MTTSTFSTGFGESSFADSTHPKGHERLPIPTPVMLERWAVLIATAAFWLIVAWAVWSW